VIQQVGGILIHPVRPGTLELVETIAAGQQSDPECLAAPGGQHVPDAVADHNGTADRDIQFLGGGDEQVRVRLRILDVVACNDHIDGRIDAERREILRSGRHATARGDGPRYLRLRQGIQQLPCAGKRPDFSPELPISLGVQAPQPLDAIRGDIHFRLA
jgi:hypothetical protein